MKYKPQPRFRNGFILDDKVGDRQTLVGRLVRQPLVITSNGERVLLDNVLGDGFALVGINMNGDLLARIAQEQPFQRFSDSLVVINQVNAEVRKSPPNVENVLDIEGAFSNELEQRLLVVRPDRYVLTTFTFDQTEQVAQSLSKSLLAVS